MTDAQLLARVAAVTDAYGAVVVDESDLALVHADVGLHNLAIDPVKLTVNGIFDYEGAAWVDRHHDFRYLAFDFDGFEMLDGACSAYEARGGRAVRRDRTLVEDLRWTTLAIARILGG